MSKLGLIAGGGDLPREIIKACQGADRPIFVVRLRGMADPDLAGEDGYDSGVAELGRTFKALKGQGCKAVCFAGNVPRPDFATLRPDLRGMAALPGAIAAARHGDDALLRFLAGEFEKEGFVVEGADQVVAGLTLGEGPLGRVVPREGDVLDIDRAMTAARAIGGLDIGQAAVAARGVVLALEAQEGTDAMLARCAQLPAALRGAAGAPAGVLAKAPKPIQDRRIDLPTIGPATVVAAARAGLAGIVGEAGALLVVDRPAVIQTADELGLFVFGLPPKSDR
ncbi:UDP-2,3-diacylglucosamine diphosphatase [Phenylobacterium montanum]|uniref:UDP-2,3-diacylglucosamine diphosphatase LpxI n=1 Tax=Phenylobacterium montanum TaxID=2823693 RepID=A0A975G0U4_9CAUL|nr:UDP-2,3-diacylglucosamine diphosphatase LpxI [Caulobacter sp. S6]QUD88524.1 UDP-2,3-diacylglucosamine diphosphatase LpxI [Caulobacter sp. S6]